MISKPQNILIILVDDMGFNDIGYNGKLANSAVRTPNIDKLAGKGVILDNYYVQPSCSPTRGQLLTGRYSVSFVCFDLTYSIFVLFLFCFIVFFFLTYFLTKFRSL